MLKKLVRHGNTFAIPIDKKTLLEANLTQDTKFEIQVLPGGGLYIHSVEEIDRDKIKEEFDSITKQYDDLFKRLTDR
jgi:antitoxin component of MazEF toxin-antitoxin module